MTRNTTAGQGSNSPNTRLEIARALTQIIGHGRTIDWVRAERPQWLQSPLHSELLYGTLRHYLSLTALLQRQLKRPLKARDLDLQHLLLVGAYQLKYTAVADYAAISECVDACKGLGKPWAKGLINGVLRALQRERKPSQSPTHRDKRSPEWLAPTSTPVRRTGGDAHEGEQSACAHDGAYQPNSNPPGHLQARPSCRKHLCRRPLAGSGYIA